METKEYIQALIRFNHPRHKEAMEIRNKKVKDRSHLIERFDKDEFIINFQ